MDDERLLRNFLPLGGNGRAAAHQLGHAPYADRLTYAFSVGITDRHRAIAKHVGSARLLLKDAKRAPHEDRGAATNERIDYEGALGEVLVGLALGTCEQATLAALLEHRPVRAVDLTLSGKPLDVKTVGVGKRTLNINCPQHAEKTPAGVVVAHLVSEDCADVYVVSGEAVARWQVVKEIRGMRLDERRWHYRSQVPDVLEALHTVNTSTA